MHPSEDWRNAAFHQLVAADGKEVLLNGAKELLIAIISSAKGQPLPRASQRQ
jgi:hypothetical protein